MFQFEADRRAFIITINSFGTELSKEDRAKLYPRCGRLYPDGLALLGRADDYDQVRQCAESYAVSIVPIHSPLLKKNALFCKIFQGILCSELRSVYSVQLEICFYKLTKILYKVSTWITYHCLRVLYTRMHGIRGKCRKTKNCFTGLVREFLCH